MKAKSHSFSIIENFRCSNAKRSKNVTPLITYPLVSEVMIISWLVQTDGMIPMLKNTSYSDYGSQLELKCALNLVFKFRCYTGYNT